MSLRLVVAGAAAGVWGFHGPAIEEAGAEVVAVYDPNEAGAAAVAEVLGAAVEPTLDRLLAHTADAAVVLAPHRHHATVATACLRAGLHVLVEKPLTVTAGEADALVTEAERCDRLLAVALQQRTRAEVVAARRLLEDGALGALQRIDLVANWPRRTSYFATAPWRGTWAGEGGGVLVNQGAHDLDLLCVLVGLPSRVTALTRATLHPTETEDTATALLEWEDGAAGTIHLSTAQADEAQRIEITGTAGRLRLEPEGLRVWRNATDTREWARGPGNPYEAPEVTGPQLVWPSAGTHADLYSNLARAIAGDEELVAPARSAAAAVELANAIIESGATGASVALPLDRAGYDRTLAGLVAAAR